MAIFRPWPTSMSRVFVVCNLDDYFHIYFCVKYRVHLPLMGVIVSHLSPSPLSPLLFLSPFLIYNHKLPLPPPTIAIPFNFESARKWGFYDLLLTESGVFTLCMTRVYSFPICSYLDYKGINSNSANFFVRSQTPLQANIRQDKP